MVKVAFTIAQVLREIIECMNILSPHGCEKKKLKTILELGITAYDTSYIVLAKNNELTLITEDKN